MLAAVGGSVAHIDKLAYCGTTRFSFSYMTLSPWGQDFTQYKLYSMLLWSFILVRLLMITIHL